jgi:transglutaminase-like putative cysteine protease
VIDYIATVHGSRGRAARRRVRPAGVPPPEPLLPVGQAARDGRERVRRHRRRREARRGRHARGCTTGSSTTSGSSGPTDDAVDTLLLGAGVCRDYAHLVLSLLRARDVPARLAAVYAPGLDPMDFHAVVEAWVAALAAGRRHRPGPAGVDAADRHGRDAADTAFMTTHCGTSR